jgi:hypothetical protein
MEIKILPKKIKVYAIDLPPKEEAKSKICYFNYA